MNQAVVDSFVTSSEKYPDLRSGALGEATVEDLFRQGKALAVQRTDCADDAEVVPVGIETTFVHCEDNPPCRVQQGTLSESDDSDELTIEPDYPIRDMLSEQGQAAAQSLDENAGPESLKPTGARIRYRLDGDAVRTETVEIGYCAD